MTNTSDAQTWDDRYAENDQLWSGHVNGSLATEAADLSPGRALDVGCGEGADAIWLAEQGWVVTAADISGVAIERGRTEAAQRELDITWLAGDLLAEQPASGPFDLVSLHYPAFAIEHRTAVVSMLTQAVAPGGTLLVVGHRPPDEIDADAPFDPADYVQPGDIAADIDPAWTVECHETRARPGDHHHGSYHSHDIVLRVRRPA